METEPRPSNFLRDIVAADVAAGRHGGRVVTRFPPEPNGYPHLGHAQSICLNFGLAAEFGGATNLRYDDTNPEGESLEFARALEDAVRWLGFEPAEVRFASDYFEQLYAWAVELVDKGLAYVDGQTDDEIRAGRGTVTEPGTPSPDRDRPAAESLRLLDEMRRGEHPDGAYVLRARIDTEHGPMAHPNMKLRDPIMYRVRRNAGHYRRGDDWHVYPLYDWAHGQGDAIEGVTHSVCTLEFDVNRPLYDWYLDAIGIAEPRNHQYEFARFNLDYTVTSKRKLRALVEGGAVSGWDDPRMPTIAGQRRRGVRPQAIRSFFDGLGVTKVNGSVQYPQYEYAVRDDLNGVARRVMAVTDPVPLTVENLDAAVTVEAPYWPHDVTPPEGAPLTRALTLGPDLYVERDDVSVDPPKGWRRLAPGAEVRLRHGYVVRVTDIETDDAGGVVAVRATADLDTLDAEPEGRRVAGVVHWANAADARPATFRLYDRLFTVPQPGEDFLDELNPDSLVERGGYVEPSVADDAPDTRYQFERLGYFWRDPVDSAPDALVFDRIVALRDSWGKKAAPAPPRPEKAAAPARDAGPRDPASALTDEERGRYDVLVGRGVGEEEAAVLAADADLLALFEETVAEHDAPREAGAVLVHDLRRALGEAPVATARATGVSLAAVLRMVEAGALTRNAAAEAVAALAAEGGAAEDVVAARGLAAIHDAEALAPAVDAALDENPDEVARYQAGETKLFGFFVGQAMRRAGKGANPQKVQTLLRERLA
ncbi:glutamine--tRNA ligase/YqeY domain fusion protein [Rubrivirga sp. S365]|uniref:Glutamine--tRNA ligase n=1 Tax=Rubrivirga litoralis TaxID=3075598 RepID=A0ABU3BS65_9BACT|nr:MULTISPECIES: glutamine--tRNA ligase/YqeY domain fusion protein [unclassified Rubrivirga]MDT0632124.1 glutamine--tRNA ligase/YqeY domain fusion protein [Rubrivirga sp. F394]MDT7857015.1 glutamine--tRNA ligase/YqeY domain fusion protein [Rubrivirga sp. S365]